MNVADRVVAVTLVVAATVVLIVTIVMSGSEGAMSIVAAIVAGTPGLLTWLQGNRTRDRVEAVHDKVNGGLTDRLHQQTDDIVTTLATRMAVNSESDRGNTSRRGRGGRVERSQQ